MFEAIAGRLATVAAKALDKLALRHARPTGDSRQRAMGETTKGKEVASRTEPLRVSQRTI